MPRKVRSRVYTLAEFTKMYGINPKTFIRWVEKGVAPRHAKIGNDILIFSNGLKKWEIEFAKNHTRKGMRRNGHVTAKRIMLRNMLKEKEESATRNVEGYTYPD